MHSSSCKLLSAWGCAAVVLFVTMRASLQGAQEEEEGELLQTPALLSSMPTQLLGVTAPAGNHASQAAAEASHAAGAGTWGRRALPQSDYPSPESSAHVVIAEVVLRPPRYQPSL